MKPFEKQPTPIGETPESTVVTDNTEPLPTSAQDQEVLQAEMVKWQAEDEKKIQEIRGKLGSDISYEVTDEGGGLHEDSNVVLQYNQGKLKSRLRRGADVNEFDVEKTTYVQHDTLSHVVFPMVLEQVGVNLPELTGYEDEYLAFSLDKVYKDLRLLESLPPDQLEERLNEMKSEVIEVSGEYDRNRFKENIRQLIIRIWESGGISHKPMQKLVESMRKVGSDTSTESAGSIGLSMGFTGDYLASEKTNLSPFVNAVNEELELLK